MKVLFIGDMVGKPGRSITVQALPYLKEHHGPFDFVIANGENAAAGRGLTVKVAEELFSAGIDCLTSGNHIWDKKEIYPILDQEPRILRPANYPPGCPGQGVSVIKKGSLALGVVSLQGRVFMPDIDCPFRCVDGILAQLGEVPVFIDFHAEATSEKRVLGAYLDGRVSAFVGTHTHVQTADEEVLPGGTAYISDVGMTGSFASAIGMKLESVLPKFLTGLPSKFEVAEEDVRLNGVVVHIDDESGIALDIKRVVVKEAELW
nr:TIGR00282 family metallophosphoesterase [uncultured Dethiosulfovibrio sp.]